MRGYFEQMVKWHRFGAEDYKEKKPVDPNQLELPLEEKNGTDKVPKTTQET